MAVGHGGDCIALCNVCGHVVYGVLLALERRLSVDDRMEMGKHRDGLASSARCATTTL